jgi:hypothetical protein
MAAFHDIYATPGPGEGFYYPLGDLAGKDESYSRADLPEFTNGA